jgi:hypothetical protein
VGLPWWVCKAALIKRYKKTIVAYVVHPFAMIGGMRKPKEALHILVADVDDVVGLIGSRLLLAALDNKNVNVAVKVQVAVQSPSAVNLPLPSLPQLPNSVALIRQQVKVASPRFSRRASLVLGFSGVNEQVVSNVRSARSAVPIVNLCSFVPALETDLGQINGNKTIKNLHDSAHRFAANNNVLDCDVCERHREDDESYWLNIADVCARFAVAISKK